MSMPFQQNHFESYTMPNWKPVQVIRIVFYIFSNAILFLRTRADMFIIFLIKKSIIMHLLHADKFASVDTLHQ